MQADYHVHSISPDARQEMRAMCQAAVDQGIGEIAVTDHYEFYYGGVTGRHFHAAYLERYFKELRECRRQFAGRLRIRAGMELGQGYQDEKRQNQVIGGYPFDYLIGSLHKLYNMDLETLHYCPETLPWIVGEYVEQLIQMAQKSEFDCLGHLDLVKRYAKRAGYEADFGPHISKIAKVLTSLIERGKGIEVNTSSLRQGAAETMPGQMILELYQKLGGTIVTVGSDAHCPKDVGKDIKTAYEQLKQAGFCSYAVYEKRICSFVSLS